MSGYQFSRREFLDFALKVAGVGAIGGVGALAGCARGDNTKIEGPTNTIVDSLGRRVTFPKDPQHIACADSFAGEYLITIGAGAHLTTIQNGTQSAELFRIASPAMRDLPSAMLGGTINAETVLASGSQIALMTPGTYENKPESDKLKKLGIPVAAVGFSDIATQMKAMAILGSIAGGEFEKRSNELIQYFKDVVSYIEKGVAKIPQDKRFRVYHANGTPLTTDGDMSVGTDWIPRCGGIPVSAKSKNAPGKRAFETSVEQIYLWDPDVIICNETSVSDDFLNAPSWKGLRAVKNGKVFHIPIGGTRWGQTGAAETYLGMLWFVATFYQEYFPDLDLKEEVKSYYKHFLGLDITDALYEQILSSEGLRKAAFLENGLQEEMYA